MEPGLQAGVYVVVCLVCVRVRRVVCVSVCVCVCCVCVCCVCVYAVCCVMRVVGPVEPCSRQESWGCRRGATGSQGHPSAGAGWEPGHVDP